MSSSEEKLISTLKSKFESEKTRNIYPRDNYNNLLSFGANEMSICKQGLMFQEEINCETTISVREAASNQSLSGGRGFLKCYCKSKCSSNRCKCKKNGKLCNSRCHNSGSCDYK